MPAFNEPPRGAGAQFSTPQEARDATSSFMVDQRLPYSINWNLGVQHVIQNDYTLEVSYLGTRGVHLITQSRINARSVVTPERFLPTYLRSPSTSTLAG